MRQSANRRSSDEGGACRLPVGLRRGDTLVRACRITLHRGRERQRLLDLNFSRRREALLSDALACHVETFGGEPATSDIVDQLSLPDRHALVRAILIAEGAHELSVSATCATGHRLDMTLDLAAIDVQDICEPIGLTRRGRAGLERRALRLPRPRDLAAVRDGLDLLARCLDVPRAEARPWLRAGERALTAADPLGAIEVVGCCADCGVRVTAEYDLVAGWLARLRRQTDDLLEQIHALAVNYHWSESDILGLPDARRESYLDLCWQESARGITAHHA